MRIRMKRPERELWIALFLLSAISCVLHAAAADEQPAASGGVIGRQIERFTAKDFRGKTHSLSDYHDKRVVVVYFLGTECPLAKLYGPRIQKVLEQFTDDGITVLGVSSNVQDSITELAAHARAHELTFPILKDLGQQIADQFGATRTPQVFVLDADRKIRYYGSIDAQFTFGAGVGLAQPQEQRADLVIALEELVAGQPVTIPVTEAQGCLIGRARTPQENSPVSYSNQIARLIQARCLECHREGQIAPFTMNEYEEVAGWGEMIAEVVRERRMPPWHADPTHGQFTNENRLSDDERQLIYTWVANGCPEGDPADLPEPRKFREGWFLPQAPDKVVYLEHDEHVKAEGVEGYRYIEVDPGIKEDKWVKLAECMPGNRSVVHHIIVYVKPPGSSGRGGDRIFLAGFAPGTRPLVAPEGWAKRVPADSKFIFEMHYTPIGTPQTDRSGIGMIFMDEKDVTHRLATTAAMQSRFEIPPYEADHKVTASRSFHRDTIVLSLFPHMHMRGKSFRYELTYPDKSKEVLLDVPRYDFNWQNSYIFAEPKSIPKGSLLECTAVFDNSDENLHNPDPSKTVRWGDQTWHEMMIGWYDIGIPVRESTDVRR